MSMYVERAVIQTGLFSKRINYFASYIRVYIYIYRMCIYVCVFGFQNALNINICAIIIGTRKCSKSRGIRMYVKLCKNFNLHRLCDAGVKN